MKNVVQGQEGYGIVQLDRAVADMVMLLALHLLPLQLSPVLAAPIIAAVSPKKMKCKHSLTKAVQSTVAEKKTAHDLPSSRKSMSKGHSNNKTDALKDVPEDGQIPPPQLDAAATASPLKEPHVTCGLGSGDVSESSLRPSLLDEVLSEKKLLLMRSPHVIKYFKRHQSLLAKRSSNILQLGTHNLMDKAPGKS